MIVEYKFKNFKSFKDETIFYMTAVKGQKDLEENILSLDNKYKNFKESDSKLLKIVSINGQNASGKSNFIESLRFMKKYIEESHYETKEKVKNLDLETFMFSDKKDKSTFELTFICENSCYNYGFELNNEKIFKEWLYKNDSLYFQRDDNKIKVGKKDYISNNFLKMAEESLKEKKHTLALSLFYNVFGISGKDEDLKIVNNYFIFWLQVPSNESVNLNLKYLASEIAENGEHYSKILSLIKKFIRALDVRIVDIELSQELNQEYPFISVHELLLEDGTKKIEKLPFSKESEGTKKILKTAYQILMSLSFEGSVLIFDELDDKIHTNLFIEIIRLFQKSKSQFIFASHNPYILEQNLLRRDQIYFVDKNQKEESELYSLSDFKGVRKTDSYQKRYLNGNYGAVPIIDFSDLEKELGFDKDEKK